MTLTLYHLPTCPYCLRVRQAAQHLGIELRLRDIARDPEAREELIATRGRRTVPVLRVEQSGRVEWIGESEAIVEFLLGVARVRGAA
ncbi:MAG: glutaredoxin [Myxococcales bacterium]|nr:glutaredoxin [Myxococcales bacterium]MDD9966241.1 glutaredoxin [Myxococcales bacterium]